VVDAVLPYGIAIAVGGPYDGHELGDPREVEFEVVMADLTRHRYVGTTESELLGSGVVARIYRWSGRVRQ
jgi:hypothetical protein